MLGKEKIKKTITCPSCGFLISNLEAERQCSNCFACTGCEIYMCPVCKTEAVIKSKKPMATI